MLPILSDGAEVSEADYKSLSVVGRVEGSRLIFEETKLLSFDVIYDKDNWGYNSQYSTFFKGDTKAGIATTESENGVVGFTYQAVEGESVRLSDFENVRINLTARKLPVLRITLEGKDFNWFDESSRNKETWVDARMVLEKGSKTFDVGNTYGTTESPGYVRVKGRGHTSWTHPKKPYSINLRTDNWGGNNRQRLLGMGRFDENDARFTAQDGHIGTHKYAIVPSYSDHSMLRNYITYKMGQEFDGIAYNPRCEFVEVYLNGVYNGIYILVERVDVEPAKVDIEELPDKGDLPADITGGYLLEKDVGNKADKDVDPWFDAPYKKNDDDLFVIKSPDISQKKPDGSAVFEYTSLMTNYLAYISAHMQKLHSALINGVGGADAWKDYIDISTWADYLIAQEVSKNIDGNMKSSTYLYKEKANDKIYMGPLWDFDNAYGNWHAGITNGAGLPDGVTADGFMVLNSSAPWYQALWEKAEFKNLVKERYALYRETLYTDIFHMIDTQAAYLSDAMAQERTKWNTDKVFDNNIAMLKNWLSARIAWLDQQWLK